MAGPVLRRGIRRGAGGGGRGACRARAARSARQSAEVGSRRGIWPNWPNTIPSRPAGRRGGFASAPRPDAKSPAIQSEPAFIKGHIEIQDEGSQLAALLSGAKPGEQVVDLCAGAGGKTLALAAMMENKGQIYATDTDKRRLAPIHARLERAGARDVQVRTPRGAAETLDDLQGSIDLVLIDAPCTGTGSWRRNPDAKWRLRPGALDQRRKDQAVALDRAVPLVKSGGRIAYVTCSVLEEENGAQIREFLNRHGEFSVEKPEPVAQALGERGYLFRKAALLTETGLLMTPRRTGTDGFFVSILAAAMMTLSTARQPARIDLYNPLWRTPPTTTSSSSSISARRSRSSSQGACARRASIPRSSRSRKPKKPSRR